MLGTTTLHISCRHPSSGSLRKRKAKRIRRLFAEPLETRLLLTAVTSVSPSPNAHTASVSTDVVANFDADIVGGLATPETFRIHSHQRGRLSGTVTTSGSTVSFDPGSNFLPGEMVQATIASEVQSPGADPPDPFSWQFRAAVESGTGTFTAGQTLGDHYLRDFALGDVDGDGDLDVFTANGEFRGGQPSRLWLNHGGVFSDSGQQLGNHDGVAVALGDMDDDGDLDAFVGNSDDHGDRLWLNNGAGVFVDSGQVLAEGFATNDVELADLDGDGDVDALVTSSSFLELGLRVWMNNQGVLTDTVVDSNGISGKIELGDLDGDGDLDAFVAPSGYNGHRVFLSNEGFYGREFVDSGQNLGNHGTWGIALGDLDGDGDLDAFAANNTGSENGTPNGDRLWMNDGAGVFTDSGQILREGFGSGTVALGDLDGDGDLDAFVNTASGDRVWFNESGVFVEGLNVGDSNSGNAVLGDLDNDGDLDVVETGTFQFRTWFNRQTNVTPPPAVALNVNNSSIAESGAATSLTVTLSAVSTQDVTIDLGFSGTATIGADYTASTQIVIPAGSLTGTVNITAVADTLIEGDETIIVDVAAVENGSLEGTQPVTITIEDDESALAVTSLDATRSGFVVEFNSTLEVSTLNLYDTETAGHGPPDVVLSGATGGPVSGSLAIDESLREIAFIKSGDPLAADTYTVTLRSALDGFKDTTGLLLDGNGDGTAGDDFSQNFVVAEPAPAMVSLPDFIRGPGQDVNLPADSTTGIPLTISDASNVRNVEVHINYDPSLLQISAATVGAGMPPGATVALNFGVVPGLAIVTFSSPSDLPAGSTAIVNLQAIVPSTEASGIYGKQQVVDLDSVTITDANANPIPATADDAIHLVSYFADVSGNGRINASDAAQVARVAALLDSAFAATPLTDPLIVGDISGNGRINAADASRVAQFAALIGVAEIPSIPGGIVIAGLGTLDLGPGLPGDVAGGKRTAPGASKDNQARSTVRWGLPPQVDLGSPLDLSHDLVMATQDEEEPIHLALEAAIEELLSAGLYGD